MKNARRYYLLILLGLLVAFGLRLYRLGDQSIWWDEGLSVFAARQSFREATLWTASDVHPPLYFWSLWIWRQLAGESVFALRYLTALQSLLTVALMAPLGRQLSGRRWVGAVALWFLALSRFHVWWSQELRMYILAGLCTTASLYFTLRLTGSSCGRSPKAVCGPRATSRDLGHWIGWALSTLGALYTVYSSITLILVENLFLLVVGLRRERRWSLWRRWLLAQIAVGLVVVPWLALALPRMRSWTVVQEPASLGFVLQLDAVLLTQGISADIGNYLIPAVATVVAMIVGLVLFVGKGVSRWGGDRRSAGGFLLGIAVLLPPLIIWALTQPRSFFYTPRVEARYLLPFAPAFYALLALSLDGWGRVRWLRPVGLVLGAAFVTLLISVLPGYYAPRYVHDDFVTLSRLLEERRQPDDAVVLYTDRSWPVFISHYAGPWHPIPDGMEATEAEIEGRLAPVWSESTGLWLVTTPDAQRMDPAGLVPAWLTDRAAAVQRWSLGSNSLTLYARTPARAETLHQLAPNFDLPAPLDARLPTGGKLAGFRAPLDRYRTGDVAFLSLYWERLPEEPFDLHLSGPEEAVHTVEPSAPAPVGLTPQLVALPLTPDLPAGDYVLRLPVEQGAPVDLATFTLFHPPETRSAAPQGEIEHPMDLGLGESIRFLGYALDGEEVAAGETLDLTLYWQTSEVVPERYKIFVHLVGETFNADTGNFLWGQDDSEPVQDTLPTTQWVPDTVVADPHEIVVAPTAPQGRYTLQVGLYGLVDGARLPVFDAEDAPQGDVIVLTEIKVR